MLKGTNNEPIPCEEIAKLRSAPPITTENMVDAIAGDSGKTEPPANMAARENDSADSSARPNITILKRPPKDILLHSNNTTKTVNKPVKSLAQREREYDEARRRIFIEPEPPSP